MRLFGGPGNRRRRRLTPELLEARQLLTTLQITEINYNPYVPLPEYDEFSVDSEDYAFIELGNVGSEAINLQGLRLARLNDEGVDFVFDNVTLEPDERIVVVEDVAAFQSRYGTDVNLAGAWSGGLSRNNERLTLLNADDGIIQQFEYESDGSWPRRANGLGATLELKNVNGDPDRSSTWRSSREYGGTPGVAPSLVETPVIINEIFAHSDLPQVDAIELYNSSETVVDIGNWHLSDTVENLTKFRIPVGTEIPAGGYVVFDETDFNPGQGANETDFALSEFGEELWLTAGDGSVRPTRFVDNTSFGASLNGVSLGLMPNGDTRSDMLPMSAPTFGSENDSHWKSPVVIEEVHYHPLGNDVSLEFIELRNATGQPLLVGDWRIEDAVDIVIPDGTRLGAGERLVLVSFDPADEQKSTTFRTAHEIDNGVTLLGPWGSDQDGDPKRLSNGGEEITLTGPIIDPIEGTVYHVADQVDYDNSAPWPITADGFGASLQRSEPAAFGNDGLNWVASMPSPGGAMESEFSWQNSTQPLDVDNDGNIVAFDVLLIINYLNGEVVTARPAFLDVNNDGSVAPFDALQIINHLNNPTAARPAVSMGSQDFLLGAAIDIDGEEELDESPARIDDLAVAELETRRLQRTDGWVDRVESLFKI